MKRKDFDAVEMMRRIRDDLSQRYVDNPEVEDADLQRIRDQYRIVAPAEATAKE